MPLQTHEQSTVSHSLARKAWGTNADETVCRTDTPDSADETRTFLQLLLAV